MTVNTNVYTLFATRTSIWNVRPLTITSAKKVMFSSALVSPFVNRITSLLLLSWASIPPNTLEQVPPFPSPSFPLPSLPLPLEVGPLLRLGGLWERFSFPSGSGRSPAAKRYLVNFRLKISPLVATIFRSFSEINHSVFAET